MSHFLSFRFLSFLVLLLLLQSTFSFFIPVLKGRPDFLYLAVLDRAFFGRWGHIPFFALAIGLLRDTMGGHLWGVETLSLTVSGLLLYFAMLKLKRDHLGVQIGVCGLFVVLAETLSLALGSLLGLSGPFAFEIFTSIGSTTLYTVAVSPGFFWAANRWFHRAPALKQYELFS